MAKSIRVIISGRVQGVGYRAWTVGAARQHGLTGWVRNLTDGNVEALFHGEPEKIDAIIKECWKGPSASKVIDIKTFESTEKPNVGFEWISTK